MKKLTILLVLALLLAACTPKHQAPTTTASTQPSTAPSTTQTTASAQPITFLVYMPDDNCELFITAEMTLETLEPERIVEALIAKNVLAEDVAVNRATVVGKELALDMNEAFLMQLYTMGTTGERMLIGCLVNTFLSAYGCEYVMLTVDGEIINSGHVEYTEPLYPFT